MEKNEINECLPQSLSKILDDIPIYPPIHQEEKDSNHVFDDQALSHENWNNKYQFYLIKDHPTLGFRVQNEPTDIHYGVCSECHKAAPINAMCPSSSNPYSRCRNGRVQTLYITSREQLKIYKHFQAMQLGVHDLIFECAWHQADSLQVGFDCKELPHIQLDKIAYGRTSPIRIITVEEHCDQLCRNHIVWDDATAFRQLVQSATNLDEDTLHAELRAYYYKRRHEWNGMTTRMIKRMLNWHKP